MIYLESGILFSFMSIIFSIFEWVRERKKLVFFAVLVLIGGIVFFFGRKSVPTDSSEISTPIISTEMTIEAKQAAELDAIAQTLPRYSEEEINRQYRELDAIKSNTETDQSSIR